MLSKEHEVIPADEAFEAFQRSRIIHSAKLVEFVGAEGWDVYNPSLPFTINAETWIAGRVENRDGHDSRVQFFKQEGERFTAQPGTRSFVLEDPFIAHIHGQLVFGGVSVVWEGNSPVNYKTVFYRGSNIENLTQFAQGPDNMKDIRLCELADGRIGVFTRPRDLAKLVEWGSLARIGFTVIAKLEDLNAQLILDAPLLEGQFIGVEWGGANHAFALKNGLVGVVGHRSCGEVVGSDDPELHYYGIAFALNPDTLETTPAQIIISRDCFPEAPPKRPGLLDVTFSSGMIRNPDGTATVYTGLSDSAVGVACIPDPFLALEELET